MPRTREEKLRYQAAWRARNPTYQRDLKKWRRAEEPRMPAELRMKAKLR